MASISGNFLAWEFEMQDEAGNTMALIDRNFQGFAKEIFTDAGTRLPSRPVEIDAVCRLHLISVAPSYSTAIRIHRHHPNRTPPPTAPSKNRPQASTSSTLASGRTAPPRSARPRWRRAAGATTWRLRRWRSRGRMLP
jgi:hypothetical protein